MEKSKSKKEFLYWLIVIIFVLLLLPNDPNDIVFSFNWDNWKLYLTLFFLIFSFIFLSDFLSKWLLAKNEEYISTRLGLFFQMKLIDNEIGFEAFAKKWKERNKNLTKDAFSSLYLSKEDHQITKDDLDKFLTAFEDKDINEIPKINLTKKERKNIKKIFKKWNETDGLDFLFSEYYSKSFFLSKNDNIPWSIIAFFSGLFSSLGTFSLIDYNQIASFEGERSKLIISIFVLSIMILRLFPAYLDYKDKEISCNEENTEKISSFLNDKNYFPTKQES
jgi:hypothetical protein